MVDFRNRINFGGSSFFVCPDSGHNIHWNNTLALSNLIINNFLGTRLDVPTLNEQFESDSTGPMTPLVSQNGEASGTPNKIKER